MTTSMSRHEWLEYTLRLFHPKKIVGQYPGGLSDEAIATLIGTDITTYQNVQASLQSRVRQAAEELLSDTQFAALVDQIPFATGAKVVGFGSSTTDDLFSWFELLRTIFALRRPQDNIRFVNAGLSGDTTTQEISRMGNVISQRPDWIICHISSNDGRRHGISPTKVLVSPEETEKNLLMLRHYAASLTKARWIWMTPTALIEERIATFPTFKFGLITFTNEDSARITEAVLKQPDPVVNLWDLFGHPADPSLVFLDGLHPDLPGHQRILQTLVRDLVKNFA